MNIKTPMALANFRPKKDEIFLRGRTALIGLNG